MTKQKFTITVHKGPLFEKVIQQSQIHLLEIARKKVMTGELTLKDSS